MNEVGKVFFMEFGSEAELKS